MSNVSLIDGHIEEPKYKDEEIIKALRCCTWAGGKDCESCPYNKIETNVMCTVDLMLDTLALINRKDNLIKRITIDNKHLKSIVDAELDTIHALGDDYKKVLEEEPKHIQNAKIKVITDFAERLNEKATRTIFRERKYVDTIDVYDTLFEMEREIIEH